MPSEAPSGPESSAQQDPSALLPTTSHPHDQQEPQQADDYRAPHLGPPPPLDPVVSSSLLSVAGPSTTSRPGERSPLKRGSSRESDMHRSSTPPDGTSSGSIKYTRTGRVSKATKGQRVHQCDECGKTYTRAEHLRRHQQNHNPGAFPCDVPGCGRSFYREDLLIRHRARQYDHHSQLKYMNLADDNSDDPQNPPSRRGSVNSQHSEQGIQGHQQMQIPAPTSRPRASAADTDHVPLDMSVSAPNAIGQQQSEASRTPRKEYLRIHELPVASQAISINTSGSHPDYPFGQPWNPPSPRSPIGYESPTNDVANGAGMPYFGQLQPSRARNGSSAAFLGTYAHSYGTRSPVSAGSSTLYMPQWTAGGQSPGFNHFSSSSSSDGTYINGAGVYNMFGDHHMVPIVHNGVTRMMSAEERDATELVELALPSSAPRATFDVAFDSTNFVTNEQRYICAYWSWVHPLYPVVHKLSFNDETASPLLRASMLALGAHILQNPADMGQARIIHERCTKVIKKRTINSWHTYRVCDMQAIVLHEVYSIFKSRRPPLHFSKPFEDVYRMLADDPHAMGNDDTSSVNDSPMQVNTTGSECEDDLIGSVVSHYNAKCKQRLLVACYILDQQHATLFGRQQTAILTTPGTSLPFIRSQEYWDATPEQQSGLHFQRRASGIPLYTHVYEAVSALPTMAEASSEPHDAFQSLLIMASDLESSSDFDSAGHPFSSVDDNASTPCAMEQSARIRLAYHTFMLCKHTPIRDLLAVAGESWCMAEKLGSQIEYAAAQLEALTWAKGWPTLGNTTGFAMGTAQAPVQQAVHHARQILAIHRQQPKTGILFQEWSIYLAAVVIWARAYVTSSTPHQKPRRVSAGSHDSSTSLPSAQDLQRAVVAFIGASNPTATISTTEVKNILLWTKAKIEKVDMPHNCGLTNGALDVLGKLSTRGAEQGWFGDV